MTRPTPEPKPCPFCGKPGVIWSGNEYESQWYCGCRNERCAIMPCAENDASKGYAVAAWNRRAK